MPKYDIRAVRKLTHSELLTNRLTEERALEIERFPIAVILQDVRSLYNVGSIFRSADAFRISKLFLTGYTPFPPRKEISKTALGAERTVPWEHRTSALEAIQELKTAGWNVYAVELAENSSDIVALSPTQFPAAFVLGNELIGLDADVLAACTGAFEIAMHGVKHSLNVAVAAGIVMHQASTVHTSAKQ